MVTVGMNYDVLAGKESAFEDAFTKLVDVMRQLKGHKESCLYRDVHEPRRYLIISKWTDKAAFDGFIASDAFREVAHWGMEQVLATNPHHEVYGA